MMSMRTVPVAALFREWERQGATIGRLAEATDHMPLHEAHRQEDVIHGLVDEQAVTEQLMVETLEGTPAAALCKLRVALAGAEIVASAMPGVRDPLWEMVRSAMEDLLVNATPRPSLQ